MITKKFNEDYNMPVDKDIKKVLIIGSGPIQIGQAAEFDYSGSQACKSLREEGIETVLVNSNPATIQTDIDMADTVYTEPLTPEVVAKIIKEENVDSILPTMGGQTGLNIATGLGDLGLLDGIKVLGAGTLTKSLTVQAKAFSKSAEAAIVNAGGKIEVM